MPQRSPAAARGSPQAETAAVMVTELTRCFGARTVLHELSLTLHGGERLAVLGRNGAGKTTLLRCIAGSLTPTTGSVLVGGCAPSRSQTRAQIGAVLPGERS